MTEPNAKGRRDEQFSPRTRQVGVLSLQRTGGEWKVWPQGLLKCPLLDEADVHRHLGGSRKPPEGAVGFEFVSSPSVHDVLVGGERGERGAPRRASKQT